MIATLLDKAPRLSVVAPCYNEEAVLSEFLRRITAACQAAVGKSYEIVLVNDGSRDTTWDKIQAAAAASANIVGVNLSRNYGHQLAVTAGLDRSRGDRVLIIDADLQDPPELVGEMMALMDDGYDVIYARRRHRAQETRLKKWTAALFYQVLSRLADIDIPRDVGDFRLVSRRVVDRLNQMPEQDRYIRGMVAWIGGRQTEILFDRDPRYAGETKYTFWKVVQLAVAGITSFSTAPLRLASFLAGVGVLIALGVSVYIGVGFLRGDVVRGWTSLALMSVFFGISQLACLSIMGAYLGRTYLQVKGRPLYLVNEIVTQQAVAVPTKRVVRKKAAA